MILLVFSNVKIAMQRNTRGLDPFKAMMPANDSTVAGDFNNQKLVSNGISS